MRTVLQSSFSTQQSQPVTGAIVTIAAMVFMWLQKTFNFCAASTFLLVELASTLSSFFHKPFKDPPSSSQSTLLSRSWKNPPSPPLYLLHSASVSLMIINYEFVCNFGKICYFLAFTYVNMYRLCNSGYPPAILL